MTEHRHLVVLAAVVAPHNDVDDDFLSAMHEAEHLLPAEQQSSNTS